MISPRPLVAGFELVGRYELANIMAADIVYHVDVRGLPGSLSDGLWGLVPETTASEVPYPLTTHIRIAAGSLCHRNRRCHQQSVNSDDKSQALHSRLTAQPLLRAAPYRKLPM